MIVYNEGIREREASKPQTRKETTMYLIGYYDDKEVEPNERPFGPPCRADDLYLRYMLRELNPSEYDILILHYLEQE